MLYRLLFILFFALSIRLSAQEIPVGTWMDHLPYSDGVAVTYGNNKVYFAANSVVLAYDKSDNSIERLNSITGLSDVGVSTLKFNTYNNRLVIAYGNGNIDIIKEDKQIVNLSFIKNSAITGDKTINHIYIQNNLAYLACGFGIVVLNTDKLEITDTYLFGPLGIFMDTKSIAFDDVNIYAATTQGIYFADKNAELTNFNNWALIPDLGALSYSNIVSFSGHLFASYDDPTWNKDTLYYTDAGVWKKFLPTGVNILHLDVYNNSLIINFDGFVDFYNSSLSMIDHIFTYNGTTTNPNGVAIDDENMYWFADKELGLVKLNSNWFAEFLSPDGPSSSRVQEIDIKGEDIWVASGPIPSYLGPWEIHGVYSRFNNEWESMTPSSHAGMDSLLNIVSVSMDPTDHQHVFFGSWELGLIEVKNNQIINVFDYRNSVIPKAAANSGSYILGLVHDDAGNLWLTSNSSDTVLTVRTATGQWQNFSFPGAASSTPAQNYMTKIIVDQNNFKWFLSQTENKIIVFDDNATPENISDDRFTHLSSPEGAGNIPGSAIYSIVEDLDGEIWIGTDEGVAVFYSPFDVFDKSINAEQIFIDQDGSTQILLETELISSIAVDGANRKWFGTSNSGVFLMSEDGTKEIEHFTTDNSPLFSNSIISIAINQVTGEVYFGTDKGIISYKGTATETNEDFNNVFVYPNPVKDNFDGLIAIRGLVKDTDVKITDISGNIVYQTTSFGGQAVWDGNDFNGKRVQSGVYLLFNGGPNGGKKAAAKILFIN